MTVENVLERTVVHEVEANGPAAAAGVRKRLYICVFCYLHKWCYRCHCVHVIDAY
jgi:hypothetical protein